MLVFYHRKHFWLNLYLVVYKAIVSLSALCHFVQNIIHNTALASISLKQYNMHFNVNMNIIIYTDLTNWDISNPHTETKWLDMYTAIIHYNIYI